MAHEREPEPRIVVVVTVTTAAQGRHDDGLESGGIGAVEIAFEHTRLLAVGGQTPGHGVQQTQRAALSG